MHGVAPTDFLHSHGYGIAAKPPVTDFRRNQQISAARTMYREAA
jgi:hypothetical protein